MMLFKADRLGSLAHQFCWKCGPSRKAKEKRGEGRADAVCQLLEGTDQLQGDLESCFLWTLTQMPPSPVLSRSPGISWLG